MQHQQGGAQYGGAPPPPELAPFPSSANPRPQFPGIPTGHPEAAAPISSRPPPAAQNFGELAAAAAAAGSFHDEDALTAGEDAERGGTPGNRWPREETLALLKIRSEMDAEFRDASLKGPLWENVSRKLGELGYIRSAKKCKEKFENVHKYYKRTKEGRAGRQDGKSYRFFSQLEALHTAPGGLTIGSGGSGSNTPTSMSNPIPALPAPVAVAAAATPTWAHIQPQQPPPATAPTPSPMVTPPAATHATQGTMPTSVPGATAGISLSSDTFTSSSYDSDDDEDTEEGGGGPSTEGRKRKRGSGAGGAGGPGGSRKMMAFFEGLMMQVMEKQEAMQQRFLETIEKREQERMVREEAWRRQEMARLNREHEILAQERAVAASRDSALIQFLQKIGGQPIHLPPPPPPAAAVIPAAPPPRPVPVVIPIPVTPPPRPVAAPAVPPPPPPPQEPHKEPPPQQQQPSPILPQLPPPQQQPPHELHPAHQTPETVVAVRSLPPSSCTELVPVPEQQELAVSAATPRGTFELGASPSRWPKSEVHALIKLRSGLEPRYQEAGPKGPLWEEISLGMQRLGYNRSSKRCKEKWENINKYFKKVKESNKKRPEDAKTCPYFHQLDALYRKKNLASTSNAGYSIESSPQAPLPLQTQPVQAPVPIQIQHETEKKTGGDDNTGNQGGIQIQTSNGGLPPRFFEGGSSGGATINKPEDIMKELMEQQHRRQATMNHYGKLEESRNDHNMYDDEDDDDEDDEDDDDDAKMVYKMQFERQNVGSGSGNGNGGGNASTKPAAATTAGSFLGMVQ